MRTIPLALSFLFGLTVFVKNAEACPGAYASASCDGGATSDICMLAAGSVWECDISRNGQTAGGSFTAVYGYGGTYDYSAWGTDEAGNNFCCQITNSALNRVSVHGGIYADTLSFQYSTYDLSNHGAVARFFGFAAGGGGDDTISGSRSSAADYFDLLHGDGGNDTIYGYDGVDEITGDLGDDFLDGGTGADIIHGNDGDDAIYGGDGNDTITGDSGDDTVDGGVGDDFITGGDGADGISGGWGTDCLMGNDGADALCGDNGDDSLCGGADDDQIWGGSGTDDGDGGEGIDACKVETSMECEVALGGKPATCP